MSVTYHHDHHDPERNPHPLAHDALTTAARTLEDAAMGQGPLVSTDAIMGFRFAPSPELHGAGAGVLDVDYQDGTTATFDVDVAGTITPRRYAYACALVIETDQPRDDDDEWKDRALRNIAHALPVGFPGTVEFCSTPERRPVNAGAYDVRPENDDRPA